MLLRGDLRVASLHFERIPDGGVGVICELFLADVKRVAI